MAHPAIVCISHPSTYAMLQAQLQRREGTDLGAIAATLPMLHVPLHLPMDDLPKHLAAQEAIADLVVMECDAATLPHLDTNLTQMAQRWPDCAVILLVPPDCPSLPLQQEYPCLELVLPSPPPPISFRYGVQQALQRSQHRQTVRTLQHNLEEHQISLQDEIQEYRDNLNERLRLEETLRQSEAKFEIAFRASPVIMAITDLSDRRYIEVNDRFIETFGYRRDEVVGRTTLEFNNWHNLDDREAFRQMLQDHGAVRGQEHEFVTKSGDIITGIVSADIIPVNGNPCILSVIEDITQRKSMEQALQLAEFSYRSIFENALDGIFQTAPDGRYLAVNPALARMYGYESPNEILTSQFNAHDLYVLPSRRDEFTNILSTHSMVTNFESEIRRRDGTTLWITETARAVRDEQGKLLYYEGTVQNISDRKRTELALQAAKEAADAANKAKSEFLANMSHELRTPLNAVIGFTQIMLRDAHTSAEQRANLEIIHRAGEHLLDLINDVLEMSKIEAGKTILLSESFDLWALLESLQSMLQLRAETKGLEFNVEMAPYVPRYINTDQRKLRQVLLNLLSNAIKFTDKGKVELRVWTGGTCQVPSERSPQTAPTCTLFFQVTDTGTGIAESELSHLFEAFVQTESGRQSNQGTGLGLPISRKFVQLMGGDITVQSRPQEGSQFQIYIQVHPVSAAAVQPSALPRRVIGLVPNSPQYRILVVDDKWENRQLLTKLLTPIGLLVKEAEHGQEAIAIWEDWEPHLIWMDMRMPVMDGYEATKQIRASLKGQATVILALTASALEEERIIVLSAGCNDFVRKPFREAELFSKMAEYLGLQYVYEEPSTPSAPNQDLPELTAQALGVMPPEWIQSIYTAARSGDDEHLHSLILQIPLQHQALIQGLTHLTNQFQFDHITHLAQPSA